MTSPVGADSRFVAFYYDSHEQSLWLNNLKAALPQSAICTWPEVDARAEVAVAWSPSQTFIDAHPQLRYLFNLGAGVDAMLRLQLPPQLEVVRIEDAGMAEQMAEYVSYAVLRHIREFDRYAQSQVSGQWAPRSAQSKCDFPIGIMGLGVLGQHVARSLVAQGFVVHGWSQSPKTLPEVTQFTGAASLQAFLQSTQILVCLLPLTPDTQGILNKANLALLRPGAYLINVARGAHLVEEDLLDVLASGHLQGAMLDVTRQEPLPVAHPFWQHPHISITPHISAQTPRAEAVAQIARKMQALAQGQRPTGVIDRTRGY